MNRYLLIGLMVGLLITYFPTMWMMNEFLKEKSEWRRKLDEANRKLREYEDE